MKEKPKMATSHDVEDRKQRSRWKAMIARWQGVHRGHLRSFARRALPAHIGVLILIVLALVDQTAEAIGSRSYLVLVYFHLFFYPATPLGEHIENVILNLAAAAAGLGVAFAAIVGAIMLDPPGSTVPYATTESTAVGACVLVALCLIGGFYESYTPRLKTAMRTMLFSVAWTITAGATTIHSTIFTAQFYPAAFAAAASVVACALAWPETAHATCANLLIETLELQSKVLQQSVDDFYRRADYNAPKRRASGRLEQMRKDLAKRMAVLTKAYHSARVEIAIGRVSVAATRPLLLYIRKSKAWMSCGMGLGTHEAQLMQVQSQSTDESVSGGQTSNSSELTADIALPNEEAREVRQPVIVLPPENTEGASQLFRSDIETLLHEVMASISIIQACLGLCLMSWQSTHPRTNDARWSILYTPPYGEGASGDPSILPPRVLLDRRRKLDATMESFRASLSSALQTDALLRTDPAHVDARSKTRSFDDGNSSSSGDEFRLDLYDTSFLMITLLEISMETAEALRTSQILLAKWHRHKHIRILWPSLSFAWWLRAKAKPVDDINHVFEKDMIDLEGFEIETALRERRAHERSGLHREVITQLSEWSNRPRIISWRINASTFINATKRNAHVHYALKLAFGVAALSLLAWLPGSKAWFTAERGVWLIVTYVWVLETSTGATFRVALFRAFGTISAAVYAIIAWYICGQGVRPAIALFIFLAEIPASYLILCSKRAESFGVVFALTQSIILLIPIKQAVNDQLVSSVPLLGLERGYQILIGVGVAVFVNLAIWPLHARTFLVRSVAGITRQLSTVYLSLARQMLNLDAKLSPESAAEFEKLERKTLRDLDQCEEYLDIMQSEISLVPKPIETLRTFVDSIRRIRDLLVLLRRVREKAMSTIRAEACFNVLNLRTELVSCVLLNLWVVGESLLSKSKLPQFLPSCRGALESLTLAMNEQLSLQQETNAPSTKTPSASARNSHLWEPPNVNKTSSLLAIGHGATISTARYRKANGHSSGSYTPNRLPQEGDGQKTANSHPSTPASGRDAHTHTRDSSFFFVLAEHTLLSEMIYEIEKLLVLTKLLVGEQQFFEMNYLSREEESVAANQTLAVRNRHCKRNVVDAGLETLIGEHSLHRRHFASSPNNSWMQGFGLSLPLPATAHSAASRRASPGRTTLQDLFRPQRDMDIHEAFAHDDGAELTRSQDTQADAQACAHSEDLAVRLKGLEKDLERSRPLRE